MVTFRQYFCYWFNICLLFLLLFVCFACGTVSACCVTCQPWVHHGAYVINANDVSSLVQAACSSRIVCIIFSVEQSIFEAEGRADRSFQFCFCFFVVCFFVLSFPLHQVTVLRSLTVALGKADLCVRHYKRVDHHILMPYITCNISKCTGMHTYMRACTRRHPHTCTHTHACMPTHTHTHPVQWFQWKERELDPFKSFLLLFVCLQSFLDYREMC